MPDTPAPMKKTQVGVNDDGSPRYNYQFDGPEGGGVLRTGPIAATVALKDGTVYDLAEEYIPHHPGHAGPLSHHIDLLHERAGRVKARDDSGNEVPFQHVCTDNCGDEAIAERRAQGSASVASQPPQR